MWQPAGTRAPRSARPAGTRFSSAQAAAVNMAKEGEVHKREPLPIVVSVGIGLSSCRRPTERACGSQVVRRGSWGTGRGDRSWVRGHQEDGSMHGLEGCLRGYDIGNE